MQETLVNYRSPEEGSAWNQVRELIPRGKKTRGLHFEVLEYLFEHLYERISEQQLRDHLLAVRGHLQPTGDPVKVAINLAIKELQRLTNQPFELIKIQEPNPQGKQIRYVRLNFTPFHGVMSANSFQAFVRSLLFEKRGLTIRMICQKPNRETGEPFPGIASDWLANHHAWLLTSDSHTEGLNPKNIAIIPAGQVGENTLLIYASEQSPKPALGFLARANADSPEARYQFFRALNDSSMLDHLDQRWHVLYDVAIRVEESHGIREDARELAALLAKHNGTVSEDAIYQGLLVEALAKYKQPLEDIGS